jgi:glycerol kinase
VQRHKGGLRQQMSGLALALDQGASPTKACLFEPPNRLVGFGIVPVKGRVVAPGHVEQDPAELVDSCRRTIQLALKDGGLLGA